MQPSLSVMTRGPVRVLTLNRPKRLNALDAELRRRVVKELVEADAEPAVRAVVLTGAGERAFCAGQDLHESAGLETDAGPAWMATWRDYFQALCGCRKPIVAAANGVAAGAGWQTTLLADVRLAVPAVRFVMAEVDAGLPAIVGEFLLARHLGRSRTAELVLSGRSMSAQEALEAGLPLRLVAPEQLLEEAIDLANELAGKPPTAFGLSLRNLRRFVAADLQEAEDAAVAYQSEAVATGEPQAVMRGFLARRPAAGAMH